ncbi:MAG: cupin domain-containing protein [Gammaproteobacteria bacterium]|nr:cupin domain-containing protein [Gammaproteobacteria bacterium]
MSCNHHPAVESLLQHASGKTSGLQHLMIRLHCKVCDHCDKVVTEFESLGGETLESLSDTPLQVGAFQALMKRIQSNADVTEVDSNRSDYAHLIEKILGREGKADKLNWHWRTKRFAEIPLPTEDKGFDAKLIYFKKGMKVPRHTHRDKEYTLVLSGAFSDDSGEYKRGDYVYKTSHDEHSPVATSDCICLAVTTQPLKFTGTFGPVLNWFLN